MKVKAKTLSLTILTLLTLTAVAVFSLPSPAAAQTIEISDVNGLADELAFLTGEIGYVGAIKLDISQFLDFSDQVQQGDYEHQSDWLEDQSYMPEFIRNKPVLAAVATTSSYTDLINKPSFDRVYDGTTLRTSAIEIYKSATVASGNAVFHLTDNGTSGGTALCPNGVITDSIQLRAVDSAAPHAFGTTTLSNSDKTVTVPVSKIETLLGILTLNQSADGSTVKMSVTCY